MTAKKHSLIEKGVIKQDFADTEKLLAPENVDKEALQQYAIEAATFSTNYQMPNLEFAVNHYGQPDIAMFDFTSMYAAENASKVVERNGYRLLKILVGDSLLEPFWPTGSGCARGFLSSLDAAWAIRSWSLGTASPLEVLAERESIYRLLAQTTPDNLNKDWKSYTLDPATRYPNFNKAVVLSHQVVALFDTDNPASIERMKRTSNEKVHDIPKKRRRGNLDNEVLLNWLTEQLKEVDGIEITDMGSVFKDGKVLCAIIHHYRPDLLEYSAIIHNDAAKNNQIAINVLEKDLGIPPVMTGSELTMTEDFLSMASYLTEIYDCFRGEIPHVKHPKLDLPVANTKMSEISFKTIKTSNIPPTITQPNRPSSRHKHKHTDMVTQKVGSVDRKPRKRRTMEKVGASVDQENRPSQFNRGMGKDEDIAAKIKSLESKFGHRQSVDKKPKDLLRAIGKIETSDWNIKEIEKKILENKLGKPSRAVDKEKVPKWSKEQFLARQNKMEQKHLERQTSEEVKFAEIDQSIKNLDQKLKEGTARELGQNKVASITEKLVGKIPAEQKPPEKTNRQPALPTPNNSEFCHFCKKRVYLMERLSAEGRFFHHGCFKCQYCNVQLRLGSYTFDRDGLYGYRFFCLQHFGMVREESPAKVTRAPSTKRVDRTSPDKKSLGIAGVDLLDKVQTPERIEFSNLSSGHVSSDQEDSLNQIDEDEWTDKNFGASCAEMEDSDEASSSFSDPDSDDEGAYDDALEEPVTKEGTLKWAERWKNSYSRKKRNSHSDEYSSSDQSSYYDSSDGEESDTATEGEEDIRARELRKREVCVEPPIVHTDTGTDTEVKSSLNLYVNIPDVVSNRDIFNLNRSSDNISVNSGEYNSADSGDFDLNMNKIDESNVVVGKLQITKPSNASGSSDSPDTSVIPKKVIRNFIVPLKDRKTYGPEFVPKFQDQESEPLLVIKRTPSKISIPKEMVKPKVAVNTALLDKEKYFGASNKKLPPRKTIQRSDTVAKPDDLKKPFLRKPNILNKPLIKQHSLPETSTELESIKNFNFEPADEDLNNIDDYIENLLANEDELKKPIDPNKFKIDVEPEQLDSEEEKVSSSIEDLLKDLELESNVNIEESFEAEPVDKIDDLLNWMDGLDHDTPERKVCRSASDVKYSNLEKFLKTPHISQNIVSKIPKNNISFFEDQVLGKVPRQNTVDNEYMDNKPLYGLKRSRTEIRFKKPTVVARSSVDLDAVEKVNIRRILQKFETSPEKSVTKPVTENTDKYPKDYNLLHANPFKPKPKCVKSTINKFETKEVNIKKPINKFETKEFSIKKPKPSIKTPIKKQESISTCFDDLEKFVQDTLLSIGDRYESASQKNEPNQHNDNDWKANISVSSIVYPQSPEMDLKENQVYPETSNSHSQPLEADASFTSTLEYRLQPIQGDTDAKTPSQTMEVDASVTNNVECRLKPTQDETDTKTHSQTLEEDASFTSALECRLQQFQDDKNVDLITNTESLAPINDNFNICDTDVAVNNENICETTDHPMDILEKSLEDLSTNFSNNRIDPESTEDLENEVPQANSYEDDSLSLSINEFAPLTFAKAIESTDTSLLDDCISTSTKDCEEVPDRNVDIESLYATVNKNKKVEDVEEEELIPPQKPMRQKPRREENLNVAPLAPRRRKSR
ncbi:unnamed protein product [Diabrotica balteata]|uniref:F-actin monooxygenase n=1 Tax=Diabrotica balteata TaxID=107213 RepID=A0A9N9T4J5_DIABA|nr:unnamed protein product [Diabrotica balteata]